MVLEKVREKLANVIRPPARTSEAWDRLHKEAGFIPLYNDTQTEMRRKEVKLTLDECYKVMFDPSKQRDVVARTYRLFFTAGVQWFRGLDNRELAEKVSFFLQQYTEVGYMDEFLPDLFEESMQLLALSFQALDVTVLPPMIIESRPVVFPPRGGNVPDMDDEMGQKEIQDQLNEYRDKEGK